ncbi:MAG: hypothetical protein IK048_00145 [Clostridia bacterium]|nr:hypothetical protein [Clostridia bacterium]
MTAQPKLIKDKVREDVKKIVEETLLAFDGIELVELAFDKEYGKLNVTAYLWKREGVDLNVCETVHNALSQRLDAIEAELPDTYVLNVSSSGLDRKIVSNDDFRRALGTEIEVVASNKDKTHGILKEYDDEKFVIEIGGKKPAERTIARNINAKVQPYIRF